MAVVVIPFHGFERTAISDPKAHFQPALPRLLRDVAPTLGIPVGSWKPDVFLAMFAGHPPGLPAIANLQSIQPQVRRGINLCQNFAFRRTLDRVAAAAPSVGFD